MVNDEVIAYLWKQADRPEVIEAVNRGMVHNPDTLHPKVLATTMYLNEDKAERAVEATLTALLGPRPQGTNDAN